MKKVGFAFLDEKQMYARIGIDVDRDDPRDSMGCLEALQHDLTVWLVPAQYTHVEIYDPTVRRGYSYSISFGSCVVKRRREYDSKPYLFLERAVTDEQHSDVFKFLESHVAAETPFNRFGYYYNFIKPACLPYYDAKCARFFCSELVCAALEYANIDLGVDIKGYASTPDMLIEALSAIQSPIVSTKPSEKRKKRRPKRNDSDPRGVYTAYVNDPLLAYDIEQGHFGQSHRPQ
jgi:hypothetical protein